MEYVYIDSNIWNLIHDNELDLSKAFPAPDYELRIVGEQELENRATANANPELLKFIRHRIECWNIKVDRLFGFYVSEHTKEDQRLGGYGQGRYIDLEEARFIRSYREKSPKNDVQTKKKSGLYKNEADLALAARSVHSFVLTKDKKSGPLKWARDQGFRVIFLNDFSGNEIELQQLCMLQISHP